jgi:hypothetical protein
MTARYWSSPSVDFLITWYFWGGAHNPTSNHNLEDQASVFMTPGARVTQIYPQGLGTHFSRLLQQAWDTLGLFSFPVTTGEHVFLLSQFCIYEKGFMFATNPNSERGKSLCLAQIMKFWTGPSGSGSGTAEWDCKGLQTRVTCFVTLFGRPFATLSPHTAVSPLYYQS